MRKINPLLETHIAFSGSGDTPYCLEGLVLPVDENELIMTFTTGGSFEPSPENFTAITRSHDGGVSWDEMQPLFRHSSKGLFTSTICRHGGVIRAYLNTYRTETNWAEDVQSYFCESRDGGKSFSVPRSLSGCINNVHVKQAVSLGDKLLLPFSWREIDGEEWCHPLPENTGRIPIVNGQPSVQRYVDPNLEAGQQYRYGYSVWALENTHEYVGVLISEDNGKSYRIAGRLCNEDYGRVFCEPTMTVLEDGSLLMYIRCNNRKILFETRSFDGGESWSALKPLDLPTPITKVRLYTRANGDVLLLHNPNTEKRSPLSLWISHDNTKTWSDKIDLIEDDERPVSYPDGYLDEKNGCLCFAWEDRRSVYFSKWRFRDS